MGLFIVSRRSVNNAPILAFLLTVVIVHLEVNSNFFFKSSFAIDILVISGRLNYFICHYISESQSDQPRSGSELVVRQVKPAVVENGGKVIISGEHLDLQSRNVQGVRLSVIDGKKNKTLCSLVQKLTIPSQGGVTAGSQPIQNV